MPKRGERAAPPARPGGWEIRFASKDSVDGWEELARTAPNALWVAWEVLTTQPTEPTNPSRQHRLRGSYATATVRGTELSQWQYEVTSGGRIWYCPDLHRRVVWLTLASTGHPKQTE